MTEVAKPALVLDFGGVISRTPFETHDATERALGLPRGSLTWLGPFDPATDPLWQSMQADEISERDYWLSRTREVGEMIGRKWDKMADFLIASRGEAPAEIIRPEFLNIMRRAKDAGITTAVLSNELDLFYGPDFRHKLSFIDDFDLIHDATYTKTLKPDAQAYDNLARELGVAPAACVFVDDQQRNIDGAIRAGMQTVHFDVMNPKASYQQAAKLLGIA